MNNNLAQMENNGSQNDVVPLHEPILQNQPQILDKIPTTPEVECITQAPIVSNPTTAPTIETPAPVAIVNTAVKEAVKSLHKNKKEVQAQSVEKRNRKSLTANFTNEEFSDIKKVIDYRIKQGSSSTYDHFVRQCIDFALHHGTLSKDYLTGIPATHEGKLFYYPNNIDIQPLAKKGFYNK